MTDIAGLEMVSAIAGVALMNWEEWHRVLDVIEVACPCVVTVLALVGIVGIGWLVYATSG